MFVGVTKLFGELDDADIETLKSARVDAVYTTVYQDIPIGKPFFVLYEKLKHKDPYTDMLIDQIAPLYGAGHRYFELHNRPNSSSYGYNWAWPNASEFSRWFCEISRRLKAVFPEILIGYPKLSYGPDIGNSQISNDKFLFGSQKAVECADFISVLVHWKSREFDTSIFDAVHYLAYVRYLFKKDIIVIYYNNNNNVQKTMKGYQYLTFLNYAKNIEGVIGAFGHTLSSPSKDDMWITWRSQNSESSIPTIVSSREW
jgi:hypothetical protein